MAEPASLFDEALTLNPGSPSLQRDYAATALEAGDLKHAETLARGLLNDYPDDPKGQGHWFTSFLGGRCIG
jgi:predicted Zn-dependent protease